VAAVCVPSRQASQAAARSIQRRCCAMPVLANKLSGRQVE
jgi:hypothetical protein